jgi:hypothetical protein
LTTCIFFLSAGVVLHAGDFKPRKGRFRKGASPGCGDTITANTSMFTNLDCSVYSDGAALTLEEGANLKMNGRKIIGNSGINCIEIRGDGAKIWGGTVMQCDYGIRVRSNGNSITSVKISDSDGMGIRIDGSDNRITSVKVSDSHDNGIRINGDENRITSAEVSGSDDRGIRIDGNDNLILWSTVTHSHTQGIKINGGSRNKLYANAVYDSCRDGIEIEEGSENKLYFNHVEHNGNPDTCADFMEDYKPWYYAGIDVLAGSENNEIKYNRAGCNSGCVGTDESPCSARERDLWDENVDQAGSPISTNRWRNNHIECEDAQPEYSISP